MAQRAQKQFLFFLANCRLYGFEARICSLISAFQSNTTKAVEGFRAFEPVAFLQTSVRLRVPSEVIPSTESTFGYQLSSFGGGDTSLLVLDLAEAETALCRFRFDPRGFIWQREYFAQSLRFLIQHQLL